VGRAVSIAAEGRLRLTTCGKSPAVADPRHSRRGRVADAGGGHRAARSCSGHTRAPRRVGISRRSPGSSYRDDVTTILATGARRWPAQSVSTGGWAANRVRLSSVGSPFPWSTVGLPGFALPIGWGCPTMNSEAGEGNLWDAWCPLGYLGGSDRELMAWTHSGG
jgi:hypothetical protein